VNFVLAELCQVGITDPQQIKRVAYLMQAATMDSAFRNEADDIAIMPDYDLKRAVQQVIGGQ